MNEQRERKGPNPALLLLIPAAVIIAKGASRRRAMRGSSWGGPGGFGPSPRAPRHATGSSGPATARATSREAGMPPWIEQKLDEWHA
jgi:hypothetical protein